MKRTKQSYTLICEECGIETEKQDLVNPHLCAGCGWKARNPESFPEGWDRINTETICTDPILCLGCLNETSRPSAYDTSICLNCAIKRQIAKGQS